MGGLDGSSRSLLHYNTTSNTLMGGLRFQPAESWELGLDLVWTASDSGLDPFGLPAEDYVATHPSMLYDFSLTNTYSDLDVSRLDASVDLRYHFAKSLWLDGRYRYADFTDDAPYLYDTSGSVSIYQMALGITF